MLLDTGLVRCCLFCLVFGRQRDRETTTHAIVLLFCFCLPGLHEASSSNSSSSTETQPRSPKLTLPSFSHTHPSFFSSVCYITHTHFCFSITFIHRSLRVPMVLRLRLHSSRGTAPVPKVTPPTLTLSSFVLFWYMTHCCFCLILCCLRQRPPHTHPSLCFVFQVSHESLMGRAEAATVVAEAQSRSSKIRWSFPNTHPFCVLPHHTSLFFV